jgi:hypothetical protein
MSEMPCGARREEDAYLAAAECRAEIASGALGSTRAGEQTHLNGHPTIATVLDFTRRVWSAIAD